MSRARLITGATILAPGPLPPDHDSGGIVEAALGGWQVAGIVSIASGQPMSRILVSSDNFRRGIFADTVGPRRGSPAALAFTLKHAEALSDRLMKRRIRRSD